jgi:hypothetical protein
MTSDPLHAVPQPVAFFLSDYAVVENGKVFASGAFWNRLMVGGFPSVHHLSVVAVFEVPFAAHEHAFDFVVRFEDADARAVGPRIEGQMEVGRNPEERAGDESVIPFTARVEGLVLEAPGDYAAVLELDGSVVMRWAFRAVAAG